MFLNTERKGQRAMKIYRLAMLGAVAGTLAACAGDTTKDFGLDAGDLTAMRAGIWIDPNGCDHWIIDDGVEGYLTPRVRPDGTPVCREAPGLTGENTADFDRALVGGS